MWGEAKSCLFRYQGLPSHHGEHRDLKQISIYPENTIIWKDTCTPKHCSTLYNIQDMESTWMPINKEWIKKMWYTHIGFPSGSVDKNLPDKQKLWVWSLGWEDALEKEKATYSSILAWEIPRTEEPGRIQSKESQGIRQNLTVKQQQQPINIMKYYSAIKKNETMPSAAAWIDLEIVIPSKVSQTEINIIWYHYYVVRGRSRLYIVILLI